MNTYSHNPTSGLSKLQKDILAWLEACNGQGLTSDRPKHLKCLLYGNEEGWYYGGPCNESVSRAITSLARRGLVQRGTRSSVTGGRWVKLLIRHINSYGQGGA